MSIFLKNLLLLGSIINEFQKGKYLGHPVYVKLQIYQTFTFENIVTTRVGISDDGVTESCLPQNCLPDCNSEVSISEGNPLLRANTHLVMG